MWLSGSGAIESALMRTELDAALGLDEDGMKLGISNRTFAGNVVGMYQIRDHRV